MASLYPSLHEKFKSESVCPICLMEMSQTPKFTCSNDHVLCHRCKPYYYGCPICQLPMEVESPGIEVESPHMPPPIHFMPHHMPRASPHWQGAGGPLNEFLGQERGPWSPPSPSDTQELHACRYAYLGCWVKFPEHLRELHETRCQFRPFLEEEHLPTDLPSSDDLVECTYQPAGCNVRMPSWRRRIHEEVCTYKERFEALQGLDEPSNWLLPDPDNVTFENGEDPEELTECKFRIYGCLVKMPLRRKLIHELKCNYSKYYSAEDFPDEAGEEEEQEETDEDPEQQVDCKWAELGCKIRPKLYRAEIHAEKCNYRLEDCAYKDNGCEERFHPPKRYVHERSCPFAE
ncbi:uncharacterized protein LOC107268257 [Cephus cinctus]|uniref:Uncharacterized protein LOC107268257 n=1 Tax=Cephus cinctus TaxID=211228 RepID=A0AAJ7FKI6_CEPCN|nr:uncharacterized protein LOC107268257 [Cephus cinctus]